MKTRKPSGSLVDSQLAANPFSEVIGIRDTKAAIHSAARNYCVQRSRHWHQVYASLYANGQDRQPDGYHYTKEALSIFPRYNVLDAILVEVERFLPDDFSTLSEAREFLAIAGQTAQSIFTAGEKDPVSAAAMVEERNAYSSYVGHLTEADLQCVEPLYYRRVLSEGETNSVSNALCKVWGAERGDWFPPPGCARPDVVEFDADAFDTGVPVDTLRQLLLQRGIHRVFELREYGPSYEIDVSAFEPSYNGAEGFWCDHGADWVIFASHEGSVAIGGQWLLDELKLLWPNWKQPPRNI